MAFLGEKVEWRELPMGEPKSDVGVHQAPRSCIPDPGSDLGNVEARGFQDARLISKVPRGRNGG